MDGDVPDSAIVGFYHKGFSQIIVNTTLWAWYLVLFPISLRALFRQRVWSRANIYLGVTTLFMFTVTNIYFFIFLRLQTSIVEIMTTNHGDGTSNLSRLMLAQDGIKGSRVIESLPRLINFILGDGVVVHRAFVIVGIEALDHPRRVLFLRVTMILLLLASIGFSFYDGYLSILLGTRSLEFALVGHTNNIPDIIAISLSFSTNLIATICIGVTTRHQILPTFSLSSSNSFQNNATSRAFQQVVRLLVLLTETAVIYCLLQFIAILILAAPAKGADETDIATGAYLSALNFLSALYPTVLIIIFARRAGGGGGGGAEESGSSGYGTGSSFRFQHKRKRTTSNARGVSEGEGHYATGTRGGVDVGLTSIPQSLTFPSKMGGDGQGSSYWSQEPDEWQKARGSYTNFVV